MRFSLTSPNIESESTFCVALPDGDRFKSDRRVRVSLGIYLVGYDVGLNHVELQQGILYADYRGFLSEYHILNGI